MNIATNFFFIVVKNFQNKYFTVSAELFSFFIGVSVFKWVCDRLISKKSEIEMCKFIKKKILNIRKLIIIVEFVFWYEVAEKSSK